MYVCMYVRTNGYMYVRMYVRMYVCMYVDTYVYMYVCMYVRASSSAMTREASDVTAAAIPVPSRERD